MSNTLHELLHELLRNWQNDTYISPLSDLYLFRNVKLSSDSAMRLQIQTTILQLLESLKKHNETHAQVLQLRFLEGQSASECYSQLNIAEATLYKFQLHGIAWIAQRLEEWEAVARVEHQRRLRMRLDAPTHSTLFGVDEHLIKLVEILSNADSLWLLSLEGTGGIGKTSLAHVLVDHMIGLSHYQDFAWVTARHVRLDLGGNLQHHHQPALTTEALVDRLVAQLSEQDVNIISLTSERKLSWLQTRLKQRPHLIVVDNLESVHDLATLLPTLQRLCNPSRFVLTSRVAMNNEPNIHHYQLPLLSENDAFQLLRNEGKLRDFSELLAASDAMLRPIFETVGGNPLALRLVAGLLESDTIANVVSDLHEGHGDIVDHLYTYLYRRAYDLLDKRARSVWLSLALVIAPLATVEMLAKINQQETHLVRDALHKLTRMNLIDHHGDLTLRTYSIHPLTRTFLEKQIGKWDDEDNR